MAEDTVRPRVEQSVAADLEEHVDEIVTGVDAAELTWNQRLRIVLNRLDELEDNGDEGHEQQDTRSGSEQPVVTSDDVRDAIGGLGPAPRKEQRDRRSQF